MNLNSGLGRDIDRLNNRLSRLWPEESGNGNGHGSANNNDDNNNDIKNAVMDAAEKWWYQEKKEQWMFHKSSYYLRGLNAYDGQGCNPHTGCIPECPFYPDEGKLPLPPGFYEKFVSKPYLYPTFQDFLKRQD